jgi:predicted nucleic acid-binding protein
VIDLKIVVDANIIMSALIRDGHTRDFILMSEHEFYAPKYLLEEVSNNMDTICGKSYMMYEEVTAILMAVIKSAGINLVPPQETKEWLDRAEEISPDMNDSPYFALALKLGCPIWSNDKELKQQNIVKIISSAELMRNQKP